MPDLPDHGLDRQPVLCHGACRRSRYAIICIASSNAGTTSQDLKTGFLVGSTPRLQQYAILAGALSSALILGPILLKLNDAGTVYVPAAQVAPGLTTNAGKLVDTATLQGPQSAQDANTYKVWHKTDAVGGPSGKYMVDDSGWVTYLVDPGINGAYKTRPDGSEVKKFDAPKAVLMSYFIKGNNSTGNCRGRWYCSV